MVAYGLLLNGIDHIHTKLEEDQYNRDNDKAHHDNFVYTAFFVGFILCHISIAQSRIKWIKSTAGSSGHRKLHHGRLMNSEASNTSATVANCIEVPTKLKSVPNSS